MEMIFGVLVFGGLIFLPLWLILKIGDYIERYHPALWARMGRQPDDEANLRRGARNQGGWGDGGGGGDGGGA